MADVVPIRSEGEVYITRRQLAWSLPVRLWARDQVAREREQGSGGLRIVEGGSA